MVKLQEVEDEHFAQEQPGPPLVEENDDDYYTDTGRSLETFCHQYKLSIMLTRS
jgi:hypothetical protein